MTREQVRAARSRRRGAAMLETALILPLFLIFWFGIADWGIAFWIHETVVHRANAAVRWQVVNTMCTAWNADNSCSTVDDTKIKNVFLYGDPNGSIDKGVWFSTTLPVVAVSLPGKRLKDLRVVMTVSNYQWMHFTPFFASRYLGRPITVSLSAEDLKDGV